MGVGRGVWSLAVFRLCRGAYGVHGLSYIVLKQIAGALGRTGSCGVVWYGGYVNGRLYLPL